ncbi:MAG: 2Fe-2S iron-sulfur cluster-binding protein, partial [Anaerolineales bacterium]
MTAQVAFMPSGRQGPVPEGTTLLDAARMLGVEIESICGGKQTCGKCQVIIEEGRFPKLDIDSAADHVTPIDAREAHYAKTNPLGGRRLACACELRADVLITVPEESQARKQIIAKAATDRVIDVEPAVRQVYVEAIPASLDDARGDWERLQAAVAEQWQIHDLTIDPLTLRDLQPALQAGKQAVTLTLWEDREVLRVDAGYREGIYGLAVDVGSTTVAAHLCDLRTGAVVTTQSAMNPQMRYGEDL